MKNLTALLALFFAVTSVTLAQLTPKGGSMVMERTETMSMGSNTALVVRLGELDEKIIGKAWENFIKTNYGGKVEWQRKQKEWFTDNVNIPAVGGATPVDLHAKVEGKKDLTFKVWVNMGADFLNSKRYPEQYAAADEMVNRFVVEVRREQTRQELEEQEKELKRLEKELEKLTANNDRLHKEIEKAREAIKKAEEGIVQNNKDQEATRQRIEAQKQTVQTVKDRLSKIN